MGRFLSISKFLCVHSSLHFQIQGRLPKSHPIFMTHLPCLTSLLSVPSLSTSTSSKVNLLKKWSLLASKLCLHWGSVKTELSYGVTQRTNRQDTQRLSYEMRHWKRSNPPLLSHLPSMQTYFFRKCWNMSEKWGESKHLKGLKGIKPL